MAVRSAMLLEHIGGLGDRHPVELDAHQHGSRPGRRPAHPRGRQLRSTRVASRLPQAARFRSSERRATAFRLGPLALQVDGIDPAAGTGQRPDHHRRSCGYVGHGGDGAAAANDSLGADRHPGLGVDITRRIRLCSRSVWRFPMVAPASTPCAPCWWRISADAYGRGTDGDELERRGDVHQERRSRALRPSPRPNSPSLSIAEIPTCRSMPTSSRAAP